MTTNIMPLTPAVGSAELRNLIPGKVISVSCNVLMALSLIEGYLSSTYQLQTADTKLQAAISLAEAALTEKFQKDQENPGGTLYELQHLDSKDPDYAQKAQMYETEYSGANSIQQGKIKTMDSNNSVAGNILNQNSQTQTGVIQAMASINGIGANLVRIVQG